MSEKPVLYWEAHANDMRWFYLVSVDLTSTGKSVLDQFGPTPVFAVELHNRKILQAMYDVIDDYEGSPVALRQRQAALDTACKDFLITLVNRKMQTKHEVWNSDVAYWA